MPIATVSKITTEEAETLKQNAGFLSAPSVAATSTKKFFAANDYHAPLLSDFHTATAEQLLGFINAAITKQNEEITAYNFNHLIDRRHEGERISTELRDIETARKIPMRPEFTHLPPDVIAEVALNTHIFANICPSDMSADSDMNLLTVYDDRPDSPTFGLYLQDTSVLRRIIHKFNRALKPQEVAGVIQSISDEAPRRQRATNPDFVFVKNGIFDFSTKELHPFTPQHVSLSKSPVNYVPNPPNPQILNPADGSVWDVESWIVEVASSDDPDQDRRGMSELLWEIISASVRPFVSWDKAAWFFDERGANGKGTLVQLMRNLVGKGNYAPIPLTDFSKDFLLQPLINSTAILVDENDVGEYLEKSANLKAVITNDVITINRKYKAPIAWQHFGFMVQCLNHKPGLSDKSDSFFRRQCFVPFSKSFTGMERKYIKDDYINRVNVLEYVLNRVLHMSHYQLSNPVAAANALESYKIDVDTVREFWCEFRDEFVWDLLPNSYLYDLYRKWMERMNPNHKPLSSRKFSNDLSRIIESDAGWEKTNGSIYTTNYIYKSEPLSAQYNLTDWLRDVNSNNPNYTLPELRGKKFRGLIRVED